MTRSRVPAAAGSRYLGALGGTGGVTGTCCQPVLQACMYGQYPLGVWQ